jgi:DNA invertase Pin-like site-specific DNA recombinase
MVSIQKSARTLCRRRTMLAKLRPHPLQRHADVDLRQSTPGQVDGHRERTARHYALAAHAVAVGGDRRQVLILAQDLGKSGTTAQGRDACHRLMAAVGLGEVGAVCALDASCLSRAQADWHQLLAICALTDTRVVDHAGIDDPNECNDRVLVGFKGTWSHTEWHVLRLRLQGAKLHQARQGELRCHPPTGSIYAPSGTLVLDPDESVVAAVRRRFAQCKAPGSAFGVIRYVADHQLPCPRRRWAPGTNGHRP